MSVQLCSQELVPVMRPAAGDFRQDPEPAAGPPCPCAELDVPALLSGAREGDGGSIGELLQYYRNYLMLLATTQIERRLRPRVSPSDIVQETMLRAHRHFGQF